MADQHADCVVVIEEMMQHHLGCPSPEGWVLCLCCETFKGPVFHRRHVAVIIAQALKEKGFVITHWREVVPEPAGGWPSQQERTDG